MKRTGTPLFRHMAAVAVVTLLAAGGLATAQATDRVVSDHYPAYTSDRATDRLSDRPAAAVSDVAPNPHPQPHPCERVAAAAQHAARMSAWLHQSIATHERILAMLGEREARVLEALEGNVSENQTIYLRHVLERIHTAQGVVEERLERLRAAVVHVEERIAYLKGLVERCREYWDAPVTSDEPSEQPDPAPDARPDVKPVPASDVRSDVAVASG